MDKYQLLSLIAITNTIFGLGIILIAVMYQNYWLLLLLLGLGLSDESREDILWSRR